MKRRTLLIILTLGLLIGLCVPAQAAGEQAAEAVSLSISGSGYSGFGFLTDGKLKTYNTSSDGCALTLTSDTAFSSVYILFDLEYGEYTVTDNNTGKAITAGSHRMLHEYIPLEAATTSVTLSFDNGPVRLSEISAYTAGQLPEDVQVWQPPLDGHTDLLLLSTHGDDDQLFFAGLLPYYAGELGYDVQVAYLTDHRNMTNLRTHEMINGLWAVGVRAYPVFGDFDDFRIDSLEGTLNEYQRRGTSKDALLRYVVSLLRRFNPQVVVGHDFNGEYGHGMHMLYTDLLVEALDLIGDEEVYPDIAEEYGVWEVSKAYIHLYEENPIVLNYDIPLEAFDGMTAYEVTKTYGFPAHATQQDTWFRSWLNGDYTKASQITRYSPCEFGLYHTTVGPDVNKNDFMENIVSYDEQARLEEERIAQEEAAKAEAERQEEERRAQEEAAKAEAERQEAERQEAERQAEKQAKEAEEAKRRDRQKLTIFIIAAAGLLMIVLIPRVLKKLFGKPKRKGKYSKK